MKIFRINLIVLLALSVVIHLTSLNVGWSFERKTLLEDFTSSTCPPCATSAAALEAGLEAAGDDVVAAIAIHVGWPAPGNDPWWLDNEDDTNRRRGYYGINGVPTYLINGTVYRGSYSANAFRDAFIAGQDEEAPVSLDLSAVVVSNQLMISASVTAEDDLENVQLYIALNDDYVYYAGGTTSQRDYYDSMVKMIPNGSGTSFSIEQDETIEFNFTQDMEGLGWHDLELDNLIIVAWIQGNNREVHQAQNFIHLTEFDKTSEFVEGEDSDEDGRVEAGETGEVNVSITNPENGVDLFWMSVTLTTDDETIEILNDEFTFETLEDGEEINNFDDPFLFRVSEDAEPHPVTFYLEYSSDVHNFSVIEETVKMIGWPPFLVVSSTQSKRAEDWLVGTFGMKDLPWTDHFRRTEEGWINLDVLQNYDIVVWHSFNEIEDIISEFEEEALEEYLDDGGTVVFSSYGFVQSRGNSRLMSDYFHAALDSFDTGQRFIHGVENAEYFEDTNLFAGSGDGPGSPRDSPSIVALDGGDPITYWSNRDGDENYGTNGVMYEDENFRTLLFSFPIESSAGILETDDLSSFMYRIWTWYNHGNVFVPSDENELPLGFHLNSAYPNPFNSNLIVPFNLDASGMVELVVFDLSGRQVTTLVNGFLHAGRHRVNLNGDAAGMTNGVYYLKYTSGSNSAAQKIVYLK